MATLHFNEVIKTVISGKKNHFEIYSIQFFYCDEVVQVLFSIYLLVNG